MKKKPTAAATLFVGSKSSRAIPINDHLRRDFLIQSTLDPNVRSIEYHPSLRIDDSVQEIDAIIIDSDAGRFAVDLVDVRPACDPRAEGLMHLAFNDACTGIMNLNAADIRAEPRFSSCREVWRHGAMRVRADDRAQIMDTLDSEGPFAIRALDGLVKTHHDATSVIYALACEGTVTLDLRFALNERTIIRAGVPQRRTCASRQLAFGT